MTVRCLQVSSTRSGRGAKLLLAITAALLTAAPPALAQSGAALSVGVSASLAVPTDPSVSTRVGPSVLFRLRGSEGFGPSFGFAWFSTRADTTVNGQKVELGRFSIKGLMGGVGFGRDLGSRLKADLSLMGGLAFVNVRETGNLKDAYEEAGLGPVSLHVSPAFAWRAKFTLWRDLGSRFGLMTSFGYAGVQPSMTTTTAAGARHSHLNLNSVVASVGLAYGIF